MSADASVRCGIAGCKLPRLMGQAVCVEHKSKPLTFKEGIAAGPRFAAASETAVPPICVACGLLGDVDLATRLGRCCWSSWRFSMERKS